ncbi:MAG: response regulator, partial [Planctomycetota bacterium]
ETILLVEDEEGVRRLLVDLLGREGYHVLAASGGPEALAAAAEHAGPIRVLLTDVVMPDLSGTELARRLKAERPEMEVLFMTGYADDVAEPSELAELGAAVLPKPFGPEALIRAVRDVLDKRR